MSGMTSQYVSSWNRIVGAQAPPPVSALSAPSCPSRTATCVSSSKFSQSVEWKIGIPGRYSNVEFAR
jgi:hypothetical protein